MKKIFLILSFLSFNIEPMQRLGNLGSLAARARVISVRQCTTQATSEDVMSKIFMSGHDSQSTIYLKKQQAMQLALAARLSNYANPKFNALYEKVLKKEHKLNMAGYWCFYHAQISKFGFFQDLTKSLINELHKCGVIREKLDDDFLIIQNRPGMLASSQKETEAIKSKSKLEQEAMMINRTEERQLPHRLSVNAFLAGNLLDSGKCTLFYLMNNINYNITRPDSLKINLYEQLHIPKTISYEFMYDTLRLRSLYSSLFLETGRLLQICIPKNRVDEFVYLASAFAYKIPMHQTLDGDHVKDVSKFLELATTKPECFDTKTLDEGSECAIPLTHAGVLNPSSGIKIFAYNAEPADAELYKKYLKAQKNLARKIAQETGSTLNKKYYLLF